MQREKDDLETLRIAKEKQSLKIIDEEQAKLDRAKKAFEKEKAAFKALNHSYLFF